MTRARLVEIAPTGYHGQALHRLRRPCLARSGWARLCGAHMVSRPVPKRAMQALRGTLRSKKGSWRPSQPPLPEVLAQPFRGNRHLTQRSRVDHSHCPRSSSKGKLDHGHPTWQPSINSNRQCRWNTDPLVESMICWARDRCRTCMTQWNAEHSSPAATEIPEPGTEKGFQWKSPKCEYLSTFLSCSLA